MSEENEGCSDSDRIQPISRALSVLETLTRRPLTTIADLHGDTGLPKSTLVDLLKALIAEGYVERLSRCAGYRLTSRVSLLASGYRRLDLLVDVARPLMEIFTQQHKWPLYLGIPEKQMVSVRYSTALSSPVAPEYQQAYHHRFSLILSALGRAYLAFCPNAERQRILAKLIGSLDSRDDLDVSGETVGSVLARVKIKGYATTALGTPKLLGAQLLNSHGRSIAVPVFAGRRAIAAISMRYYQTTYSEVDAARVYLKPLQELADAIGQTVNARRKSKPEIT